MNTAQAAAYSQGLHQHPNVWRTDLPAVQPCHHLVNDLVRQGQLVRLVGFDVIQPQTFHYLAIREEVAEQPAVSEFREWVLSQS